MTITKTTSKTKIALGALGIIFIIFLCFIGKIGEDVSNEEIVINQVPFTGTMEYWTTPGWKFQKLGKTTNYYKTNQLWFNDSLDINKAPVKVTFNDASIGFIYGSLRVKLPTQKKYLERIQTDYNGMERLMNDLVRPTVIKVVYASGPLMSAFESYAEKKNDLIAYITDQLNHGVYQTKVTEQRIIDPLTDEEKLIKVASLINDSLSAGGYKRSENSPFGYYGLEITQVSVSEIDYEMRVRKQIETQQENNMSIQTSKSQALAARQIAIKAEEEGKAQAMTAKWAQEKIKAVEVTKAEQQYAVATLDAKQAIENAKKVKAEGEAEAYRQAMLVKAGLSPSERAKFDMDTRIGVAEAISKIQLPKVVMSGGGSGSNNSAMDAMGMKMLLDVIDKLSK